jgi:hypothetical protein
VYYSGRCRRIAHIEHVYWRGTEYAVSIPDCRHNYARKIINSVEEFGIEVGWFRRYDGSGNWRYPAGIVATTCGVPIPQYWIPDWHDRHALYDAIAQDCRPAAEAGYRQYYWLRDIARAVQARTHQRGRVRCPICRTIYPWDRYNARHREQLWHGLNPPMLCDRWCELEWQREQERQQRRERSELEWLRKGRRLLTETRKLLKSPSEQQQRLPREV